MNRVIRREIFKVLDKESKDIGVSRGGFHIFQFNETNKGTNYTITIVFNEIKEVKE